MRLPRATLLALTADRPTALEPIVARRRDGGYWLSHCEGFKVESPQGQVGVVESVVYAGNEPRPRYLAVASGRFVLHTELVPCGDVVSIDPRETRLTVRAGPARPSLRATVAGNARRASHRRHRPDRRDAVEA